jgi:hypothetical protein
MRIGQRQVALTTAGNQNAKPFNRTKAVLRSQGMEICQHADIYEVLG